MVYHLKLHLAYIPLLLPILKNSFITILNGFLQVAVTSIGLESVGVDVVTTFVGIDVMLGVGVYRGLSFTVLPPLSLLLLGVGVTVGIIVAVTVGLALTAGT